MSMVYSQHIISPTNKQEECAVFAITDDREKFTFENAAIIGETYTISFWVKSETSNTLFVDDHQIPITTEWVRHVYTYLATSPDIIFDFGTAGNYYIYHLQLENGNQATDWTPAPEDVNADIDTAQSLANDAHNASVDNSAKITVAENDIRNLANQIAFLVRGENGESLMTQTEEGWAFDISKIISKLDSTAISADASVTSIGALSNTVDTIKSNVGNIEKVTAHISATQSDDGQPQIELSASNNSFRVIITNTSINFMDGVDCPAYISNKRLNIDQAQIDESLSFPTPSNSIKRGEWVWKTRANGNYGLTWKELT